MDFHRFDSKQYEGVYNLDSSSINSYYSGITSGREIGCKKKAHEFSALRCDPSNYTSTDILGLLKVFVFQMGSNSNSELTRLQILILDDQQALVDLDPYYKGPDGVDKQVKSGNNTNLKFERLTSDLNMFLDWMGKSGGSNGWTISGEKHFPKEPYWQMIPT